MVSVGVLSLSLAARYFQPWLSADYIYPQLFVEDVLSGKYPLSGWTLSSAPYFFPDMTVLGLLKVAGGGGTVLPAYVVFSYLGLAALMGWSLQRATQTGWTAWLAGVAFVNALLLWQSIGDHAHYLWLFGTAGFHGGAVLLGLTNFALWAGPEDSKIDGARWMFSFAVLVLGIMSDTLFLIQAVGPFLIGLLVQAKWNWRRPRVRSFLVTLLSALMTMVLLRLLLLWAGSFNFSKVFRYLPTPATIGRATTNFSHDLSTTLIPGAWGFFIIAIVSGVIAAFWSRREKKENRVVSPNAKLAMGFAVGGLAATTLMPLITTYWRDANHVRYIQPWLILPAWLALVCWLPSIKFLETNRWYLAALGMVFVAVLGFAVPGIRTADLQWPYPERQARLDQFLLGRGLKHGLSGYWQGHEINALSRTPMRVFEVKPDGSVSFWNNNAFWFYEGVDRNLTVPDYNFIVIDGLDQAALRQKFGEAAEVAQIGGYTLWLYTGSAAKQLTQRIEVEVHDFVRGRPGAERIALAP